MRRTISPAHTEKNANFIFALICVYDVVPRPVARARGKAVKRGVRLTRGGAVRVSYLHVNTVNVNTGRIYTYLRVNTADLSRKYQAWLEI